MKIYKRQIRPMIKPPALQGFNTDLKPFFHSDAWFDEDMEDHLQFRYKEENKDPMSTLVFDERYVEVEMPICETFNIKSKDVLVIKFDPDKCDVDLAVDYGEIIRNRLPDDVTIILAPSSLEYEVMDKDETLSWINVMKKRIEDTI